MLIHSDQTHLAEKTKEAISTVLAEMPDVANALTVTDEISDESIPQVVAYLASENAKMDDGVIQMLDRASIDELAILPVIVSGDEDDVTRVLPESLSHINALTWRNEGLNVATSLLRMLGLLEDERKIFISYRRTETFDLATQLHTELVRRRFDVFLDRFSVDPGIDFQRRLDEELGDKAFVLLLESNKLHESEWVRHEIAFAHSHRIALLALTLPDCENRVPSIDDAFRLKLEQSDLTELGDLSDTVLASVMEQIELAHYRALRRRREQILESVSQKLSAEGCQSQLASDWCIYATKQGGHKTGLFWVTPRRPGTIDFYGLSQEHERVSQSGTRDLLGAVVHDSGRLADEYEDLMEWIVQLSQYELATIESCSL